MINKERTLAKFMEIVQIDSVSKQERAMADYLINHFSAYDYEVVEDVKSKAAVAGATAGNIIVKVPGKGELTDAPAVLLSAHMDTVEPGNGVKPRFSEDGKRIISDGTTILGADDKGGIAQILELIEIFRENEFAHPPLELVFPICEEIRLLGTTYLDTSLISAKRAYVLDGGPEAGDILVGGPSAYDVYATIRGRAAHAGVEPEKGISSIQVAAHAIANMKLLKIDEDTSSSIGSIESHYPINVVPEITKFAFEVRSLVAEKADAQLKHMMDCVEAACEKFGATVEWNVNQVLEAYQLSRENSVIQHYYKVCEAAGIEVRETISRGGTDLSSYIKHGLEGVVIATGGIGPHMLDEYLDVDIFMSSLELLIKLITTI